MHRHERAGNALVIVLAVALLLMAELTIVGSLSSENSRHLERVTAHVHATLVAESAFSHILARIKGAPWSERWFATAPAVANDIALTGGTYSSYVATVPTTSEHLADVWIRGRYDGSLAVMFWRVKVIEDTLDFTARVYPQFFTHLPGDSAPPTGAPGDPTLAAVDALVAQQKTNHPRAVSEIKTLEPIADLPGIVAHLGVPLAGALMDARQGMSPTLPQADYVLQARRQASLTPAPPPPPPLYVVPPAREQADVADQESRSTVAQASDGGQTSGESDGQDRTEGGGE